jgi:hypothetical protein
MSEILETQFKTLLDQYGIEYIEQPGKKVDFFLPLFNLYVEVTAHATERTLDVLESLDGKNVLVLVGLGSVKAFQDLLSAKIFEARSKAAAGKSFLTLEEALERFRHDGNEYELL